MKNSSVSISGRGGFAGLRNIFGGGAGGGSGGRTTLTGRRTAGAGFSLQSYLKRTARQLGMKPKAALLVVFLVTLLFYVTSPSSDSGGQRQSDTRGSTGGWWSFSRRAKNSVGRPLEDHEKNPRVDRSILGQLEFLEELYDDRDPIEALRDSQQYPAGGEVDGEGEFDGAGGVDGNGHPDSPPVVGFIPEPLRLPKGPGLPLVPSSELDPQFCGNETVMDGDLGELVTRPRRCRFLLPAWLGEQETKSQMHLYQLGLLANSLNRTLILPNVVRSRLGTCYSHPFSYYYSPDSLDSLGIPTMNQTRFLLWVQQRDPPPSAQIISMVGSKAVSYPTGAIEIDSSSDPALVPRKPTRNLCVKPPKTRLAFDGFSPMEVFPPDMWHKTEKTRNEFGESVINTLASGEVVSRSRRKVLTAAEAAAAAGVGGGGGAQAAEGGSVVGIGLAGQQIGAGDGGENGPDVLVFNYELRFPMLPQPPPLSPSEELSMSLSESEGGERPSFPPRPIPFRHFPYSSIWLQLSDLLTSSLSPFLAIHWRTETLAPFSLVPCSQSLLDKIEHLVSTQYPLIKTVYFATDYPIEDLEQEMLTGRPTENPTSHSGTFKNVVTEEHHEAMKVFLKGFRERKGLRGVRLTGFVKEMPGLAKTLAKGAKGSEERELARFLVHSPPLTESEEDIPPSESRIHTALTELDPGLLGIIDKSVLMSSEVFLTGFVQAPGFNADIGGGRRLPLDSCGKESSFTRQVVWSRRERREKEESEDLGGVAGVGKRKGRLWNEVDIWKLGKGEVEVLVRAEEEKVRQEEVRRRADEILREEAAIGVREAGRLRGYNS